MVQAKNRVAVEYPATCGVCASTDPTPAPTPSPEPCAPGGVVWNSDADGHSCGSRIDWLQNNAFGGDLIQAKNRVAAEYPNVCGACASVPDPCAPGGSVWEANADGHSCGSRIQWLEINAFAGNLVLAKSRVAEEYPNICGACTPGSAPTPSPTSSNCVPAGNDCGSSRCCSDSALTCFEKDQHWAECRTACVPGIHSDDPPEYRTPWSCVNLETDSPSGGRRLLRGRPGH